MSFSTKVQIVIAAISVMVGIAAWQWPKAAQVTNKAPGAVASIITPAPPVKAVLQAKRGPERVILQSPLIEEYDLTVHNLGTGIAEKVVLSCGILDSDQGSRGKAPPIAPNSQIVLSVYILGAKDDTLHAHDAIYCPHEPVISYSDDAGTHTVSFDPDTGEADPLPETKPLSH